ncbi:hypothetical protein ACWNT8_10285 [Pigmentibacter ruber]|uniref:hypothetical protein n=1 Tax=Pigmentibacter ruber TaxID=2683196 RepID=UPI00131B6507|nr:hypothetical protein [Pigmentibacter ruber]BFD32324.1 hypothetical protein GTC16762_19420 [Pigmentibacter ruber]
MVISKKSVIKQKDKKDNAIIPQKDKTSLINFKFPLIELILDYLKINQMEIKDFCKKFKITQKEFLSLIDPVCDVPFLLVADIVEKMGYDLRIEL